VHDQAHELGKRDPREVAREDHRVVLGQFALVHADQQRRRRAQ
jgi:hypothetical protein